MPSLVLQLWQYHVEQFLQAVKNRQLHVLQKLAVTCFTKLTVTCQISQNCNNRLVDSYMSDFFKTDSYMSNFWQNVKFCQQRRWLLGLLSTAMTTTISQQNQWRDYIKPKFDYCWHFTSYNDDIGILRWSIWQQTIAMLQQRCVRWHVS
jgi:hypothetical protein